MNEMLLEQQYSLLNSMYSNLPVGIILFDTKGDIYLINRKNLDMMGVEEECHLLGKNFFNDCNISDEIKNRIRSGEEFEYEIEYDFDMIRKKNRYPTTFTGKRYFKVKSAHIKDNTGRISNYLEICEDITEEHKTAIELEKRGEELNLALDVGEISAWTYSVENHTFQTLYGNAVARDGITLEEIGNIMHPDDVPLIHISIDNLVSEKSSFEVHVFRFKEENTVGGYRYYDSRMIGKKVNGKVTMITGTQHDNTEDYLHKIRLEEYNLKTTLINKVCNIVQWDYNIEKQALNTYSDNAIMPHHDITLEKYLAFVHPDDREYIRDMFGRANNRELDSFSFEIRLMLPGAGDYKKVSANGIAIKDNEGHIIKYTGIRRDISNWVEMNARLKEQNSINALILDNINSGLIFYTPECKIVWSNLYEDSHLTEIMHLVNCRPGLFCKYSMNGVCGRLEECIVDPSVVENKNRTIEYRYGDKYVEATSIPVNDEKGTMIGILLKLNDITERKLLYTELIRAKEDALLSSQILNIIIDRMPCAVFIKDASDGFCYTKANALYCNILGRKVKDVEGKTDYSIYDKEIADKYRSYDIKLTEMSDKEIVSYDSSVSLNGNPVYWQISKSIIHTDDGHVLIIGIATDVSKLREINQKLKEAQFKAEQSDKLKSAFLANMSHEIRTPLNAIVGFSDLLADSDSEDEKIEYSKIISSNSDMLLRLIGDILDLSRIESGTTEFKRELIDLSFYFNELASSLKMRLTNPAVKYIIENPYDTCYVSIDKERFGQILTNFVTNSIKYTPEGFIKVGYCVENKGIKLYVTDSGIGIPSDKKERVFHRFDKLDSFAQGTGLGLSISKALTEYGGGKVGFESEEGKGSTFWSWKPFPDIRYSVRKKGKTKKILSSEEPEPMFDGNFSNILVAEDNEGNFILTKTILKGYNISWAQNGAEAVEMAAKNKYDLILMDIKMPIMDGLDATMEIRKFNKNIPIIVLTANAFASDEAAAFKAGVSAFLRKPFKKADLLAVINRR